MSKTCQLEMQQASPVKGAEHLRQSLFPAPVPARGKLNRERRLRVIVAVHRESTPAVPI